MRRIALGLGAALAVLVAVMLVSTLRFQSRQVKPEAPPALEVDAAAAAARLGQAVRWKTVSHQEAGKDDATQLAGLHGFLQGAFPTVHARLQREVVAERSLVYTWKGSDPSLKPLVLMGHMDVVPVEPGTEGKWTVPPFSGEIRDGYVWGRGTLDDKGGVLALLEATEALLKAGHQPKRTIYLAFGHDEETLGTGAGAIVKLLGDRGVRPELVLDEGMVITQGMMPGVAGPVALVGTAEKGYVSLELVARGTGGHSSMPPAQTAVGILAQALVRLEQRPMPAAVSGLARQMFEFVGPEMAFPLRLVFANLWLTSPLVERILLGAPSTAALIRTTTAPTQLEGSVKENVLAQTARAVVNFRIKPGDTSSSVLYYVQHVIADPRVEVRPLRPGNDPVRPAPVDAPAFALMQRAIRQVAPEAVVAPALMLGATDGRQWAKLAENIYRFRPVRYVAEDLPRLHGTNERVSVEDHARCIRFDAALIRGADTL